MTPRGTDWGLALVVALLFATGIASLFAATPGEGWVFAAHDVLAFALAGLLVVKLRRVWQRLTTPSEWDRLVKPGVLATMFVAAALGSSGSIGVPLLHLALLGVGWVAVARVALRRFA